jgi:uracil-DNA glycosylase
MKSTKIISDSDIDKFVDSLKKDKGLSNIRNPWKTTQNVVNFKEFLKQQKNAKYILIGEAPGRFGCLQCGVPFCDDYTLEKILTGVNINKENKTAEESAQRIFAVFKSNFIAWNAFPYNPYSDNKNKTNRKPTSDEINKYGLSKLKEFLDIFYKDKEIILLGNSATKTYNKLLKNNPTMQQYKVKSVIHPSKYADIKRAKLGYGYGLDGWKKYIKNVLPELDF